MAGYGKMMRRRDRRRRWPIAHTRAAALRFLKATEHPSRRETARYRAAGSITLAAVQDFVRVMEPWSLGALAQAQAAQQNARG